MTSFSLLDKPHLKASQKGIGKTFTECVPSHVMAKKNMTKIIRFQLFHQIMLLL